MQQSLQKMIKFFFKYFISYLFLISIRLNLRKKNCKNFKDLNFKQVDFTNYKIIRYYTLEDNFINNISKLDIHSFDFLSFYQKIGGKKGVSLSKKNIFNWFEKYKYYQNFPWKDDYASKRFINIIYNYDYICSASNHKEIKTINYILNFHIERIVFDFKRKKLEDVSSYNILSFVLIEFIKNNFKPKTLQHIVEIINIQIDENSMHKSYNVLEHAKFLNNMNEIKNILLFFNLKSPDVLNNKILAMTSLLTKYRHDDLSLPLFNGSNNNYNYEIKKIIEKEQFLKNKTLNIFKNGIAAYKDKSKTLFFDVIQPTKFAFNKELSASSLAFEISAEGEKIITNCGGAEGGGKNPGYLKYSAAHSTIIINNTNISEIKAGKINRIFPKQVFFDLKDSDEYISFNGTHNGYLKNYRKICKRRLKISKRKNIFLGEDIIISTRSSIEKVVFHIRFHIMPGLSTTITKNLQNVIIKTKKNNIWVFKSNNKIMIEKSIYVKDDIAVETSQIVISGTTSSLRDKIKWSLEKI